MLCAFYTLGLSVVWGYNKEDKGGEYMPIRFKIDVLAALKDAGYSSARIRKDKLMGEATLQQLRHGVLVSWKTMETLCRLLNCQPGDIIEYVPAAEQAEALEE